MIRCCNYSISSWFTAAVLVMFFSAQVQANPAARRGPAPDPTFSKADRTYISGALVLNEFRSIRLPVARSDNNALVESKFPLTAQTYALAVSYGTYITDHFKTEIRYGRGIRDKTLDKILDVNINHWFSWYMGAAYPVTDYLSAYALYGVSFYEADMTRREDIRKVGEEFSSEFRKVQPSRTLLDDNLFGTNFSTSWMLGADYRLKDNLFLAFEYGRLIRDTDSNIKVYQGGIHLRYEY